jgi:four helix bundle protein
MQDFRNLDVWKKSHELAIDVHKTLGRTKKIDASIRAQLSRAANSIPSNIVEGCGRASRLELARFSDISIGSSTELEYWLLLSRDLGQLGSSDHERLTANNLEVRKMLFGLRRAIRNGKRRTSGPTPDSVSSSQSPLQEIPLSSCECSALRTSGLD